VIGQPYAPVALSPQKRLPMPTVQEDSHKKKFNIINHVRKSSVFLDATPCGLVKPSESQRLLFDPEDSGHVFLWNIA
jgi:hypothetical protein